MLHRRSSLSLVFVVQGYDAKACRRLQSAHSHACDGPNRASLRRHPDRQAAYQAPFTYLTPMSAPKSASFPYPTPMLVPKSASFPYPTPMLAPKSASFPYPTPMSAPKSASFPQPTRLHAPKRGVFGKAVYQSLLIYVVYRICTIKSDQIYGV